MTAATFAADFAFSQNAERRGGGLAVPDTSQGARARKVA
jgi:hypothetical protein